eukprot:5146154-Prorocentrum_lima.AAC.1
MEHFCAYAAFVQITSVLCSIEHQVYVWDADVSFFITSFDEEEQDTGEVELYLPPALVHWRSSCPHELKASE